MNLISGRILANTYWTIILGPLSSCKQKASTTSGSAEMIHTTVIPWCIQRLESSNAFYSNFLSMNHSNCSAQSGFWTYKLTIRLSLTHQDHRLLPPVLQDYCKQMETSVGQETDTGQKCFSIWDGTYSCLPCWTLLDWQSITAFCSLYEGQTAR